MKLSRSRWENFIRCPFCFYIKEKHNIDPPSTPRFNINMRVDSLLKEEFDQYRKSQKPHPIFKKYNLNFVPYKMDEQKLKDFRNNFKGVRAKSIKTNYTIFGSLDDLWFNKDSEEVVVIDYKATSNKDELNYVTSNRSYHKGYMRQLEFYAYLLKLNKYKVYKKGYKVDYVLGQILKKKKL